MSAQTILYDFTIDKERAGNVGKRQGIVKVLRLELEHIFPHLEMAYQMTMNDGYFAVLSVKKELIVTLRIFPQGLVIINVEYYLEDGKEPLMSFESTKCLENIICKKLKVDSGQVLPILTRGNVVKYSLCKDSVEENKYEDIEYLEEDFIEEEFILPHAQNPAHVSERERNLTNEISLIKKRKKTVTIRKNNKNVRKRPRESRQSSKNQTNKVVPVKMVKEPCGDCSLDCVNTFSAEERQNIFQYFWKLTDKGRNSFYKKFVTRGNVKRRKVNSGDSKKQFSYQYFLKKDNFLRRVCRNFFLNTLSISQKRIYYSFNHLKTESISPTLQRKSTKLINRVIPQSKKRSKSTKKQQKFSSS